jgi:hypothetical protein
VFFGLRTGLHFVDRVFIEVVGHLEKLARSCRKTRNIGFDKMGVLQNDAMKQCGQSATQVGQVCGDFFT